MYEMTEKQEQEMTTPDLGFRIPVVDHLCSQLRAIVKEFGGPANFFSKLSEDSISVTRKVDFQYREILSKLLDDTNFRVRFARQIGEAEDRGFVDDLLEAWDLWRELSPDDGQQVGMALIDPYEVLLGPTPDIVNDPQYCNSRIYLDSYSEHFKVQTSLKLTSPNKELGGKDVFVMSAFLPRFIGTVRLMLESITLEPAEVALFKIPDDRKIIVDILEELNRVRQQVDELQQQFEGMRWCGQREGLSQPVR
jgi:hypothetical protein